MISVILDTNVVMSAIFFGGLPFEILSAWHDRRIKVVISPSIQAEYMGIADRMRQKFPGVDPGEWISYIAAHATCVNAPALDSQVCEDPDDDIFLSCACASDAKIVCSGDKLLLKCNGWHGIEVLTPRSFSDNYL